MENPPTRLAANAARHPPDRCAGGGKRKDFAGRGKRTALTACVVALLLALASPARAQEPEARSYRAYIESLWPLAQQRGITRETFDRALARVPYDAEVSALSRKQPEYGRPVGDYINSLVTGPRIKGGLKRLAEHEALLDRIAQRYGVPREVIVAIWGIETNFGANQGGKRVIPSLATLAFRGYKGDFARDELLTALTILQQGDIPQERMIGSWAGAMGQPQFIPSSFMRWAVDFSGDGRRDIWTSVPDVLASIANYLRAHGWQAGQPWGYEVIVPKSFDLRRSHGSFREWVTLGFQRVDGGPLPTTTVRDEAILFFPAGARGPAFLVTKNFDVIKTYNISDVYALAVLHLADRFKGAAPFSGRWPADDVQLSREDRMTLQAALAKRGFRPSNMQGMIDFDLRDDIRQMQVQLSMTPDGHPTTELLGRLRESE